MNTTRLAPSITPFGMGEPGRRDRVDPVKLLALIHRLKTASDSATPSLMHPQTKPIAKAG